MDKKQEFYAEKTNMDARINTPKISHYWL